MQASKLILILLGAIFTFVACEYGDVKPRPVVTPGDQAFKADPAKGTLASEKTLSTTADAQLVSKTFEINLCLKDDNRSLPIKKAQFVIHFPDDTAESAISDDEGCILWTETLTLDQKKQAQWVILEREIESNNNHRGSIDVSIAINPWTATAADPQVKDPVEVKEASLSEEEFQASYR